MSSEARFWSHVDRSGPCWLWTASLDRKGYGRFGTQRAHRVAYSLTVGPIPHGLFVLHRCDNPRCVRPDHLFPGTAADNTADMIAKNRRGDTRVFGDRNASRKRPELRRGARNGNTKLSADQVRAIRHEYGCRKTSQQALADRFGITQVAVSKIVRGQTWPTHTEEF